MADERKILMRKRTTALFGCLAAALFCVATTAQAAPIVISYDSFESPNILPSTSVDTPNPDGWFDTGHPNTSGIIHVTHGSFTTPYGEQALKVWQGNQTGARKNLGASLEAGMIYAISFNVSKRDNRTQGDYRAELWAGPTTDDADLVLLDKVEGIVTTNDMSEVVTHTFDTSGGTVGHVMQLRMIDPTAGELDGNWQHGPLYDNVTVTMAEIPEPASLASGLLGLMLIAGRRRR
jgi:hypothetical protein